MNPLGPAAGAWMLLALAVLTLTTGWPIWILLIAVASAFSLAAIAQGTLELSALSALPARVVGLLDSDLLQALPLYVLIGMLLQHLHVANTLFSILNRWMDRWGAGPALAALGLGALIAPMNGSVASSSALLARLVTPRLSPMNAAQATALVSASATIGVVVPPSLVLILLGDAMMRAHTEASNLPGFALGQGRIINTQDVFHAMLLPALALLLLWAAIARWQYRQPEETPSSVAASPPQTVAALTVVACIILLLAGVFTGKLLAVEAAATGGLALLAGAAFTGALRQTQWQNMLDDTLVLTGALMALLVGATVFSLVFRLLGTDRWLTDLLLTSPWPSWATAAAVLLGIGLCACVLDAFEMILVMIPTIAPPLIVMLGDAQQTAVLLLLVLQLSFLMPPMGYAVMMAQAHQIHPIAKPALMRALTPFVLVQLALMLCVLCAPGLVHWMDAPISSGPTESDQDIEQRMRDMSASDADTNTPNSETAARQ